MATRYIEAAASFPGSVADAAGNVRAVFVDTDTELAQFYDKTNSAWRELVTGDQAQTLTNKTFTSPVITELSEVVTATNVLTAAESGSTFYLSAVAGFLTTLPAPALGLNFKFVVKTSPTSVGYTIGTPTANIIFGMAVERAGGAGLAASAEDLITLVANQSIVGDWLEIRSDGTNWYVHGMVDVIAGVTFTVT